MKPVECVLKEYHKIKSPAFLQGFLFYIVKLIYSVILPKSVTEPPATTTAVNVLIAYGVAG